MTTTPSNIARLTNLLVYAPGVTVSEAWYRKISKRLEQFSKETLLYTDIATNENELIEKLKSYTALQVMHILNPKTVDKKEVTESVETTIEILSGRKPAIIIGLGKNLEYLAPIFEKAGSLVTSSELDTEENF